VRWPRETDSQFGFRERVATAFEKWSSCQKCCPAKLDSSRVNGVAEAIKRGYFNECDEAKGCSKNESLTPRLTGKNAKHFCPR
jgi:Fe-S-cluster containining protein